ncbi:hypothetical protein PESP_a0495 [Pseudoalteromonas espejiana DSM 9414]|nr:hypothetical protein PESP_a0495 [Pseudoalteromonas espejiana DSM 9414]
MSILIKNFISHFVDVKVGIWPYKLNLKREFNSRFLCFVIKLYFLNNRVN